MTAVGIPAPKLQHRFHIDRLWRLDIAWPEIELAVEIDGGLWSGGRHARPQGIIRDMEKLNEAAILGWLVIRITPEQIEDGAALKLIERALASVARRMYRRRVRPDGWIDPTLYKDIPRARKRARRVAALPEGEAFFMDEPEPQA